MNFFITGGTGIVGSHILHELHKAGHTVTALKRLTSKVPEKLKNFNINWIDGDLLDTFSYENAITSDTIIIHSAAMVSFNSKEEEAMLRINIEGSKSIVNVALEKRAKKFVHISSIAAIGRVKGTDTLNENTKWVESPENSNYSNSKYFSELEVWRGFEEGLSGFILNPSVVLSAGNWDRSSGVIFQKMKQGSLFYPPGKINIVDVRDIYTCLLKLIDKGVSNERFILNGNSTSYFNFLTKLSFRFGSQRPKFKIRYPILRVLALVDSIASIFGKKSIITKESIKSMCSSTTFKSDKILNVIDFQFTPLDKTLDWCTSNAVEK